MRAPPPAGATSSRPRTRSSTSYKRDIAKWLSFRAHFKGGRGGRHRLECRLRVCAVERRRLPVGVRPTRQPLQPEATGAVMEETKWLKPSVSVSRIGDSASVQAVTRVNAEQASKRTMRRPTRQPFRGRLIRLGEAGRRVRPAAAPG